VKQSVDLPVFAGSGTNLENVRRTLEIADGVIVGSAFKIDANAQNMVSLEKVTEFMRVAQGRQGS